MIGFRIWLRNMGLNQQRFLIGLYIATYVALRCSRWITYVMWLVLS